MSDIDRRLRELPRDSRAALDLIDREWIFKQLVEHHDTRERNCLYPALHDVTTPTERDELRARIDERENAPV